MNSSRATSTAIAQRGSRSKCQATMMPETTSSAVDDRVEQRAQPRVLAGDPGRDAVEVVATSR